MMNHYEKNFAKGCVICFLIFASPFLYAQNVTVNIQLNQLGFYPSAPKIAVLTKETNDSMFYVLSTEKKDTLYKGILTKPIVSKNSSIVTRVANFSGFTVQGKFMITIPGAGNSYPFLIKEKVNRDAAIASLKGYYFQRCSMPLEEKYAGQWKRPAGHPDTVVLVHQSAASAMRPAGSAISTPGGWYDAGDYNKYIVNSGVSMGTLLAAYEDFKNYFNDLNTNIPESNNNIPDILDETLYNLRWMFTMQDPVDGGVYNKCTNANFDGMVMPDVTKAPRYVVQKGTSATLDFAAVMAQSSRIFSQFKKELPGLSDSCLQAAKLACNWAEKNPAIAYDQTAMNAIFSPAINTGGYGDNHFEDEFFWAACELFCTTKEEQYFTLLQKNKGTLMSLPSWGNVQMLGYYSLFRNAAFISPKANGFIKIAQQQFIGFANDLRSGVKTSAFRTLMGKNRRDFNWGSNANAANQGVVLVNAYFITYDKEYINDALTNLDYLLGRNATGYCFLTGIGSRYTMHPHHRQSVSDGIEAAVPGLLAGGPNPGKQDKCTYQFSEPETTYEDQSCSFASNEIAINWNAPFVYLANAIEALQFSIGYTKK